MKKTATKTSQKTAPETDAKNDRTKNFKRLMSKHNELMMESARHKELAKELEAQEAELLKTVDVNDPEQFRKISDLRLRREICPRKVQEFADEAAAILAELNDECQSTIDFLVRSLDFKANECAALIADTLRPFFYERDGAALAEAREVLKNTNFHSVYAPLYEVLRGEGLRTKAPIFKAKAVLDLMGRVDALSPVTGDYGSPWRPKTAEQMQAEELARLLTEDGREELILAKIDMTNGKISREDAEKTVDGRIAFLQSKKAERNKH